MSMTAVMMRPSMAQIHCHPVSVPHTHMQAVLGNEICGQGHAQRLKMTQSHPQELTSFWFIHSKTRSKVSCET